jgi:hypothetical protein
MRITTRALVAAAIAGSFAVLAARNGDGAALARARELLHGLGATARLRELEGEVSSRSGGS